MKKQSVLSGFWVVFAHNVCGITLNLAEAKEWQTNLQGMKRIYLLHKRLWLIYWTSMRRECSKSLLLTTLICFARRKWMGSVWDVLLFPSAFECICLLPTVPERTVHPWLDMIYKRHTCVSEPECPSVKEWAKVFDATWQHKTINSNSSGYA